MMHTNSRRHSFSDTFSVRKWNETLWRFIRRGLKFEFLCSSELMLNLISLNVMRLTVSEINLLRNAIIRIIMKTMFTEHHSLYLEAYNRRDTLAIHTAMKTTFSDEWIPRDNNVSQHNILYSHSDFCKSQLPLILYTIKIPETPPTRQGGRPQYNQPLLNIWKSVEKMWSSNAIVGALNAWMSVDFETWWKHCRQP